MKLGLSIGYSGAELKLPVDAVLLAERLGFDSVWTAEAYGSDAITPLAYLAALTKRIRLGTGIMQLAARPPATAAMAAGTLDALAGGGRVIAGLGVSGPQIVEGWYGQPWGKPYWRIRDYVAIMRKIFERKEPVAHAGREISLPYTGRGALARMKPRVALYVGGMGHRDKNFHKEMMIRRGFGDAAARIQELFLAKRKDEAVAAVPDEFCDEMALVGPVARIRERYRAWADSGITGLTITAEQPEAMELMANLATGTR